MRPPLRPGDLRQRRIAFALALGATLLALYLPTAVTPPSDVPDSDKIVHASLFACLAFTGREAGLRPWVLAAIVVANAALSEIVQGAFPALGRTGDVRDALADLVGAALGVLVHLGWQRWRHRREQRRS